MSETPVLDGQSIQAGLSLSRLVYGAWRLGDDQDTSTKHIRAKIDACLEQGMTSFDHADIYGDYRCEALFGQALTEAPTLRQQMQIMTKCNIALMGDAYPTRRVKYYDTSAAYITKSVESSLDKLNCENLDLLMMHRPDPLMNAVETGETLDKLVDSGKVAAIGVSNFRTSEWQLLQAHMTHKLAVNQIELSLLQQEPLTDGTLPSLQLDNIRTMAWSPLAGGQLFSDNERARRLKPLLHRLADENSCDPEHIAIAWILAHPAKIIPVVGTNNLSRIRDLAKACSVQLDRETWFELLTLANGNEVP